MSKVSNSATSSKAPKLTDNRWFKLGLGGLAIVLLAIVPVVPIPIPGILPDVTNTPKAMTILILCLIYAALALSYHLLLGVSGMLSFGHALFFGSGAYLFGIMLSFFNLPIPLAILLTFIAGGLLSLLVGAIANRVNGIPFAMVTLAFAEAGSVLVKRNSWLTGGEEGLNVTSQLPNELIRVRDMGNLYWLILAVFLVVFFVVTWIEKSRVGKIASATRENDLRVNVLGIQTFKVKVIMFTVAGLMATLVGIAYMFATQSALPRVISADLTITVLVMVVLGGVGYRWGAVLGAVIYTLLDQRLVQIGGSEFVHSLPDFLRIPLSEPLFILGTLFILVVLFFPGGIVGTIERIRGRAKNKTIEAKLETEL